jgi:hypothetical protein
MRLWIITPIMGFGLLGAGLQVMGQTKEGSFKGAYYAYGAAKTTPVGEERLLVAWDENGLQLTDGFLDHTTWHCWGQEDYTNSSGQGQGYCVGVDPAGDQIVVNLDPDEKHAPNQKSWKGSGTFTSGTGKFRGITGGIEYVVHSNEFRPLADNAYVNYVTFQGRYKLP